MAMVLINSIEGDLTTDKVIKWLIRYNINFIRLNNPIIVNIDFIDNDFIVEFNDGEKIYTKNITGYWYRRGTCKITTNVIHSDDVGFNVIYEDYKKFEFKSIYDFFLEYIKQKVFCIGDFKSCVNVNKNIILMIARDLSLNVPESLITNKKGIVKTFLQKHTRVIAKPIHAPLQFETEEHWYPTYTEEITTGVLDLINEDFSPTLFQNYIEKKIEIRTFYLKGKFYSTAIFSQTDPQTQIDFRIYNYNKPNRNVPFKLPLDVEMKLHLLMTKLNFESGSIDMIYSIDKRFYFLEVNPIGQFGTLSYLCNYDLENEIALQFKNSQYAK